MASNKFFQRLSMGFGNLLFQLSETNDQNNTPPPPPASSTSTYQPSELLTFLRDRFVQLFNYATPRASQFFRFVVSWWFALSTALGSVVLAYALWTFIARHFFVRSLEARTAVNAPISTNPQTISSNAKVGSTAAAGLVSVAGADQHAARVLLNDVNSEPELLHGDGMQQEELLQILRPIRMFCELGNEIIFELIKHIETLRKREGEMLFDIGQPDDSIYLIQKGILSLEVARDTVLTDVMRMKTVTNGDSVYSVLSFIDYLTGHAGPYKTVRCRVLADSIVLRIRFEVIASVLNTRPEWLLKCIQIITSRIQRVTFTALNNYLGLNNELLKSAADSTPANDAQLPTSPAVPDESAESSGMHFIRPLQRDSTYHAGVERLRKYLGIKDVSILRDLKLIYGEVQPNVTLIEEETDSALVYLLNGQLTAYMRRTFLYDIDLIDPRTAASINPAVLGPTTNSLSPDAAADSAERHSNEEVVEVFRANYNQLVGATAILSGETSLMTVRALEKCRVIVIPRSQFYKAMKREPAIVLPVANSIVARLSPFVRQIDFAIEWSTISSGVRLYRQGDLPSNLYVVISGRFRSFYRPPAPPPAPSQQTTTHVSAESNETNENQSEHQRHFLESMQYDYFDPVPPPPHASQRRKSFQQQQPIPTQNTQPVVFVDEYGNGDLVGLAELSAMERRLTTMLAVRDSEVARIPAEVFEIIKMKFPKVTARIVRMLGMGLMGRCRGDPSMMMMGGMAQGPGYQQSILQAQQTSGGGGNGRMFNLSTLAVVSLSPLTPSTCFCMELQKCFIHSGYQCNRISRSDITGHLGDAALRSGNDFRLASWLTQQEEENKVLVLECDWPADMREPKLGYLNEVFLRQSDCILLLAVAEQTVADKSVFEQEVEKRFPRVRKELVLLHLPSVSEIRGTPAWLEQRPYVSKFYHVKMSTPYILPSFGPENLAHLNNFFINEWKFSVHGDVPRIVRTLTGRAIGLVLGGGGARGYGHIPVVQKTLSSDIPIDFVGGTSIGSFMGAIYAMWKDKDVLHQKALSWAEYMNNPLKYIFDLTWPRAAYFSGGEFNKGIYMVLADRQIEDMWLPYYCVTTDVSDFKKRVHTRGTAWRAVRASMTLAGYLPPICDEHDGHLLLDGGYVDNLPVDIMIEQMGVRNVIASDVGRHDSRQNTNYGDVLSGWWLFWRQVVVERIWPWAQRIEVPSSMDIQTRLTYLTSELAEDLLQRAKIHVHMRPPVQQFATMAFHLAPRIIALTTEYVEKAFHHEHCEQLRKMKHMATGPGAQWLSEHHQRKLNFGNLPHTPSGRQTTANNTARNTLLDGDEEAHANRSATAAKRSLRSFRTFSITDLASIIAAQEIKSMNSRSNSIFSSETITTSSGVPTSVTAATENSRPRAASVVLDSSYGQSNADEEPEIVISSTTRPSKS